MAETTHTTHRRSVLEAIENLPAPFTHMGESTFDRLTPAAATYSGAALVLSVPAVSLFSGVLSVIAGITMVVSALLFPMALTMLLMDMEKSSVIKGLRKAANRAVDGEDVSISGCVNRSVFTLNSERYTDNLNARQQRWIARRWDIELNAAIARATQPGVDAAEGIDALLDTDRIKAVRYHKKALEELQSVPQQKSNGFAEFDRQLRAQHS